MKIAVLGGSFDPPHIGHALIAQQIKDLLHMDQIWLMPNNQHAFGKKQSPVLDRFRMTKFLAERYITVSDFEIKSEGISYTIVTLNSLKKLYPEDEFCWILGSDQLDSFQKYKNWQEIIANYRIIVFPRESVVYKLKDKVKKALNLKSIPKNIIIMQNENLILTNISSSIIRKRIKNGLSIEHLVPEKVEEYIKKYNLYS